MHKVFVILDRANNPRYVGITINTPVRIAMLHRARARAAIREGKRVDLICAFFALLELNQVVHLDTFENKEDAVKFVREISRNFRNTLLGGSHHAWKAR